MHSCLLPPEQATSTEGFVTPLFLLLHMFGLENEALEACMVVLVGHGVLAVGEEHRFDVAAA